MFLCAIYQHEKCMSKYNKIEKLNESNKMNDTGTDLTGDKKHDLQPMLNGYEVICLQNSKKERRISKSRT